MLTEFVNATWGLTATTASFLGYYLNSYIDASLCILHASHTELKYVEKSLTDTGYFPITLCLSLGLQSFSPFDAVQTLRRHRTLSAI